MEKLRVRVDADRWQVFGGSWGSTLALAYAEQYPERVSELIVRGIFTLRDSEINWFYQQGASAVFPDFWEKYVAPVPESERGDFVGAYNRLLSDPDPEVHIPAAIAWTVWEQSTIRLHPDTEAIAASEADREHAVAFARIENHYFINRGWLEPNQLIANAGRLKGIPGALCRAATTCAPRRRQPGTCTRPGPKPSSRWCRMPGTP